MKRLVSDYHALDITELARGWWLQPYSTYDWVWRTNKGASQTTVSVTTLPTALQFSFLIGGQRVQQTVQLTHTLGRRGGKRPWFTCPTCQRRTRVLYHAGGVPFRCRLCCNLAYPSQYVARNQSYGRHLRGLSRAASQQLGQSCVDGR